MLFIRRVLTFWIAATLAASSAMAEPSAKSIERSRQKESAEQERAELRKKLLTLKEDIGKTEKARGHAADSLAASEAAISNANRSLREQRIVTNTVEKRTS